MASPGRNTRAPAPVHERARAPARPTGGAARVVVSGIEIFGLAATVAGLAKESVVLLDCVLSARMLSKENRPQCAVAARQPEPVNAYEEGMQRAPAVEIEAPVGVLRGALGWLAKDMSEIAARLAELSTNRGSWTRSTSSRARAR